MLYSRETAKYSSTPEQCRYATTPEYEVSQNYKLSVYSEIYIAPSQVLIIIYYPLD